MCSTTAGPDAWEQAGGAYYPKAAVAAPFTPVCRARGAAPRSNSPGADRRVGGRDRQNGLSSAHGDFIDPKHAFSKPRVAARAGTQFHWHNSLAMPASTISSAPLTSRKRKTLRHERGRPR